MYFLHSVSHVDRSIKQLRNIIADPTTVSFVSVPHPYTHGLFNAYANVSRCIRPCSKHGNYSGALNISAAFRVSGWQRCLGKTNSSPAHMSVAEYLTGVTILGQRTTTALEPVWLILNQTYLFHTMCAAPAAGLCPAPCSVRRLPDLRVGRQQQPVWLDRSGGRCAC